MRLVVADLKPTTTVLMRTIFLERAYSLRSVEDFSPLIQRVMWSASFTIRLRNIS